MIYSRSHQSLNQHCPPVMNPAAYVYNVLPSAPHSRCAHIFLRWNTYSYEHRLQESVLGVVGGEHPYGELQFQQWMLDPIYT